MKALSLSAEYNDIKIAVDFAYKFNIIQQNSGSGKTFLCKILSELCRENGIKYGYLDYHAIDYGADIIADICSKYEVVCFDNADLYLTNEITDKLRGMDVQALLLLKDSSWFDAYDAGYYYVSFTENGIVTRGRR